MVQGDGDIPGSDLGSAIEQAAELIFRAKWPNQVTQSGVPITRPVEVELSSSHDSLNFQEDKRSG